MSRRRHTPEWMQERVEEYLSGKASIKTIARVNGIGVTTLKGWVHKYREQGISCFLEREGKSFCSNCRVHCYKPDMRQIRTVMRFSGPRMVFYHPVMAIRHLIESWKEKHRLDKTMGREER